MIIIEEFNAKDYNILEVFTKIKAQFYIPYYQRKYNWTIDNEISELIFDLKNFYDENNSDPNASYYIGNIVVKKRKRWNNRWC